MTAALEGGELSASRPGRSLTPGKTRYPLYRRLGGVQVWSGQMRKISPPLRLDSRTVHPVVSHYAEWATQPTSKYMEWINIVRLVGVIREVCDNWRMHGMEYFRKPTCACMRLESSLINIYWDGICLKRMKCAILYTMYFLLKTYIFRLIQSDFYAVWCHNLRTTEMIFTKLYILGPCLSYFM
jgi:hypothetical protein